MVANRMRYTLDDSESDMDSSSMSCSNISISFCLSSSRRRGGGDAPDKAGFKLSWNDSSLSVSSRRNGTRRGAPAAGSKGGSGDFKFAWNDSSSSVATEDLEESDSSFLQLGNYHRTKNTNHATPLGKMLEQVDGVKYKDPNAEAETKKDVLLTPLEDDSEEDDLLFGMPKTNNKPETVAEEQEDEPSESEERVFRDSNTNWHDAVDAVLRRESRLSRGATRVSFAESIVSDQCDFVQDDDAVLAIWDDDHVAEDHAQIPWDEEDYEELPWHLQPDLDEDDEVTKRCKVVVTGAVYPENEEDSSSHSDDEDEVDVEQLRRLDRVQGLVIQFILKLKQKRLQSKQEQQKQ